MRASTVAMMAVAGLLSVAAPSAVAAQTSQPLGPPAPGKVQRLSLTDGTQLLGRIVEVTDSTVVFESALGKSTILRSMIARIREEAPGALRNGQYFFPNPNASRLFFAPTGRMLEKGEGYFADHWIFFPSLNFGLSDNFTLGGGMTLFPGVSPAEQLFYITPKYGVVRTPTFNLAVGALAASWPTEDLGTFGILYGVSTWGTPDASLTAGLGYGFESGELARRPVLLLGGESRASPRTSFVTENWIFPGDGTLWSAGMRFFGPGFSFDLSALAVGGSGDFFCCVPWLGLVWKF